jgi:hypothetical protein
VNRGLTIGAITACSVDRVLDGSLARLVSSGGKDVSTWSVVVHGNREAGLDLQRAMPAGVRWIRRDRVSLSEARNLVLKDWMARGSVADVVCFPDDDCLFEGGTLHTVAQSFAATDADVVLGAYAPAAGRLDTHRFPTGVPKIDAKFLIRSSSSITIFARTSVVIAAGGFDERLGAGANVPAGEDTDLLLRIRHRGARLVYAQGALMRHDYKSNIASRYHPHAAALLTLHALRGSAPFTAAIRSVAALVVRVARRRYSPAALRQFARSGSRLCVSSRRGVV